MLFGDLKIFLWRVRVALLAPTGMGGGFGRWQSRHANARTNCSACSRVVKRKRSLARKVVSAVYANPLT